MNVKEALAKYRSNFKTLDGITPNPDYVPNGNSLRWNWDETWDGALWELIYSLEAQGLRFQLPGGLWSVVRKGKLRIKSPEGFTEWMLLCSLFDVYDEIKYYQIGRKFTTVQVDMELMRRKAQNRKWGK
jgi:hypothetical protein